MFLDKVTEFSSPYFEQADAEATSITIDEKWDSKLANVAALWNELELLRVRNPVAWCARSRLWYRDLYQSCHVLAVNGKPNSQLAVCEFIQASAARHLGLYGEWEERRARLGLQCPRDI